MKTTSPAFASFAVDDPEAARRFYGTTLGLDVRDSIGRVSSSSTSVASLRSSCIRSRTTSPPSSPF